MHVQVSWDVSLSICSAIVSHAIDYVYASMTMLYHARGFGVDAISACRKLLGSRAILADAWLGEGSFVANATCAAEGDNTVMELKVGWCFSLTILLIRCNQLTSAQNNVGIGQAS